MRTRARARALMIPTPMLLGRGKATRIVASPMSKATVVATRSAVGWEYLTNICGRVGMPSALLFGCWKVPGMSGAERG